MQLSCISIIYFFLSLLLGQDFFIEQSLLLEQLHPPSPLRLFIRLLIEKKAITPTTTITISVFISFLLLPDYLYKYSSDLIYDCRSYIWYQCQYSYYLPHKFVSKLLLNCSQCYYTRNYKQNKYHE